MARRLAAVLPALLVAASAFAQAPRLERYVSVGTIGPDRIGMNLTVRDDTQIDGGHYYYVSRLADIPLTGTAAGGTITLQEPGGAEFKLHLVGNGSNGDKPLTFRTSTALAGTWSQGGKTLPVSLGFDQSYDGGPSGHWYADVTSATDADFEAMVRRFLHAVVADDRAGVAAVVHFPLTVNGGHPSTMTVKDKTALLAHWEAVFPPRLVDRLKQAIPHEMFVHNGEAMVSQGDVWFDDKGASVINLPQ